LRALQDHRSLEKILKAVQGENFSKKPLLVKLDSDLPADELPALLELLSSRVSGVIASNTTVSREDLPADLPEIRGGLSGAPLRDRATRLIARIHGLTGGRLPIIGVGGVSTGKDAYDKIRAGAGLVQLYTGLVYGGPGTVRRIQKELRACLDHGGFKTVSQAVGAGLPEGALS
jgi:dihydroorotate dehydrogenase